MGVPAFRAASVGAVEVAVARRRGVPDELEIAATGRDGVGDIGGLKGGAPEADIRDLGAGEVDGRHRGGTGDSESGARNGCYGALREGGERVPAFCAASVRAVEVAIARRRGVPDELEIAATGRDGVGDIARLEGGATLTYIRNLSRREVDGRHRGGTGDSESGARDGCYGALREGGERVPAFCAASVRAVEVAIARRRGVPDELEIAATGRDGVGDIARLEGGATLTYIRDLPRREVNGRHRGGTGDSESGARDGCYGSAACRICVPTAETAAVSTVIHSSAGGRHVAHQADDRIAGDLDRVGRGDP